MDGEPAGDGRATSESPDHGDAIRAVLSELAVVNRRAAVRARGGDATLTLVDHSLVDLVTKHPGVTAADIARHLHLDRSTISRQLGGLRSRGLVEAVHERGRAQGLHVTDAGRRALRSSRSAHEAGLRERLAGWPTDDIELLATLLARLNSASL
ncbi:MarR family winged helix-turn-helix transcriptional regulator [Rhodococcus sp. HNM0569]|uniref:MarR family winged helix-turn-helix transcriptional regulator n=1 Tax=Rhodococcus sp. HNM0569 TaxID=2716340 RepID=UPI001469D860|nr:MarR family winged helix-turn-helix transcriptional regulator [Rhodococcus sp. HNM0569]NLU83664.1 winged helix-turn-helix transcriptional regulator [Rhodococcus sp. HNM0569]